jgi:hypothetical protein
MNYLDMSFTMYTIIHAAAFSYHPPWHRSLEILQCTIALFYKYSLLNGVHYRTFTFFKLVRKQLQTSFLDSHTHTTTLYFTLSTYIQLFTYSVHIYM